MARALGQWDEARSAYRESLSLVRQLLGVLSNDAALPRLEATLVEKLQKLEHPN